MHTRACACVGGVKTSSECGHLCVRQGGGATTCPAASLKLGIVLSGCEKRSRSALGVTMPTGRLPTYSSRCFLLACPIAAPGSWASAARLSLGITPIAAEPPGRPGAAPGGILSGVGSGMPGGGRRAVHCVAQCMAQCMAQCVAQCVSQCMVHYTAKGP